MKKLIEVHDDWCDRELFDVIENFVLKDHKMFFQYMGDATLGNDNKNTSYRPAFGCGLIPHKTGNIQETITTQILKRFCQYRNLDLDVILQSRSFINLPTISSIEDFIHIDLNEPHYVLLYYINDSDGDTVLFEDDKRTIIESVQPKKGRVIFFDGSIPHRGTMPLNNTRALINFNFKIKNELSK